MSKPGLPRRHPGAPAHRPLLARRSAASSDSAPALSPRPPHAPLSPRAWARAPTRTAAAPPGSPLPRGGALCCASPASARRPSPIWARERPGPVPRGPPASRLRAGAWPVTVPPVPRSPPTHHRTVMLLAPSQRQGRPSDKPSITHRSHRPLASSPAQRFWTMPSAHAALRSPPQ